MIRTMQLITITGQKDDFDRVVLKYLSHYKIQFISALELMDDVTAIPFTEKSPYTSSLKQAQSLMSYLDTNQPNLRRIDIETALRLIRSIVEQLSKTLLAMDEIQDQILSLQSHPSLQDSLSDENQSLESRLKYLLESKERIEQHLLGILYAKRLDILSSYMTLLYYERCFQLRTYAACSLDTSCHETFTLCGFIPEDGLGHLIQDLTNDRNISFVQKSADSTPIPPPVSVTSPVVLKPFHELSTSHYLPPYPISDNIGFTALSYSLTFGLLFGDLGYGILLLLVGFIFALKVNHIVGQLILMQGGISFLFGIFYRRCFHYALFSSASSPIWMQISKGPMIALFSVLIFILLENISFVRCYLLIHQAKPTFHVTARWTFLIDLAIYCAAFLTLVKILSVFFEFNGALLPFFELLLCCCCILKKKMGSPFTPAVAVLIYAFLQAGLFIFCFQLGTLQISLFGDFYWTSTILVIVLQVLVIYVQLFCLNYDVLFFQYTQEIGKPFQPYSYDESY